MVRVVICVFLLLFAYKCSASHLANGEIYIDFNGNAIVKNTTLFFNRPFTIVIKKTSNTIYNISNIKCHFAGNKNQDFTKNQNGIWDQKKQIYTVQQDRATNSMSSNWYCDITYYISSTTVKHWPFNTEVTVINTAYVQHSEVFVNDVLIPITKENTAKGTYDVLEGEIVKVTCHMFDATYISMSYFDGDRSYNVPVTSAYIDLTMYLNIRNRKKAYVLCNVILTFKPDSPEQSIRLEFKEKKPEKDLPTFNVNGLTLAPTLAASGDHYTVFYKYFDGEFIKLTVSNEKGWNNSGELERAELNGIKPFYSKELETIKFFNSNIKKPILFNLIPAVNDLDATVSGLPFSQIYVKYLYDSKTYRTVFFNKNNNILNLTCSSLTGDTGCSWDKKLPLKNDTSENILKFSPQENTNQSSVIKCMCAVYTHEVTILRDDDTKTKRPPIKKKTPESTKNENIINAGGVKTNNTDGNHPWKLVVIIVVALIVVAAVVWAMVGLCKRRQRREKAIQSEFNYESLENTTERTMPPPAQWDNYSQPIDKQNENETETYSVPYQERNVEDMYAKPQPKSLRNKPKESMYNEPSYATVGQIGEKPTYGNLSNQTAGYSQIQPKKLIGNPNAPKVLPTESPYAEVLPKSLRPNKESSKYANVFENQRYVNSDNGKSGRDTNEYAEPAYCEIGYNNK